MDCEDEVSDDDDDYDGEEGNKKLHTFLEDDILSSNYSPSVLSISNSSNNQEVEESSTNNSYHKVDLDDESLKAAEELEICYLSGTQICCYSDLIIDCFNFVVNILSLFCA